MMKTGKNVILLCLLFCLQIAMNAQTKDKDGNYDLRTLSNEDYTRIFGPIEGKKLNKVAGNSRQIKSIVIKGNKITTILYNYGSVCSPNAQSNVNDLVWNGLGYGFEFGTLAGAEVMGNDGQPIHIISDSQVNQTQGDYDPTGSLKWGWLPKDGYSDPAQDKIASLNAQDLNHDGKPDSWPDNWYSAGAGKYLWPAFLGDMATAPDEEVYYGIDDYTNYEFQGRYAPFPSDLTKGGLGLDATVRLLQFNNPLAEDIIFMVYQITNASEKDLDKTYFGMFGDPHVGGSDDYTDDRAFFIPPKGTLADRYDQRARSMVYAWDADFKGDGGRTPGYFGWKFLESPSFDNDGIDNDDDGLTDESPFNDKGFYIDGVHTPLTYGITDTTKYSKIYGKPHARWSGDEDGDWDPTKDDVGIDGIGPDSPNYPGPDYGEGDGVPSQAFYLDLNGNGKFDPEEKSTLSDKMLPGYKWAGSEPNFGYRDLGESDQVGLTGFTAAAYTNGMPNVPKNDDLLWEWFTKPEIDPEQPLLKQEGDNIFCFSTGPLALKKGESQRFSMAIIMGQNIDDLILNSITSVRILEADYRFAQPPAKPFLKAIPGDKKVTLYWDAKSEDSVDPLSREKDFEGYKIYRSRDFNFSDVYSITDANGVPFLGQALMDDNTGKRAQWDLVDDYQGLAPVEYEGRGVKFNLGSNTGLVHEYVDSTVQNGLSYYYAVVAYDRGSKDLPPSETQAVIAQDPLTGKLIYDVNTACVTPQPLAKGTTDAEAGIGGAGKHLSGDATGSVDLKIYDKLAVDSKTYKVDFIDSTKYNMLDSTGVTSTFFSKDTVLVALGNKNIMASSIVLRDAAGNTVDPSKYIVIASSGLIAGKKYGDLPQGQKYSLSYRFYPVYGSGLVHGEDANPYFDGMRLFVQNQPLAIDLKNSKFLNGSAATIKDTVVFPSSFKSTVPVMLPQDWEVRWKDCDTYANGNWIHADSMKFGSKWIKAPFTLVNTTTGVAAKWALYEPNAKLANNGRWDWGEGVAIIGDNIGNKTTTGYQFSFNIDSTKKVIILPKAGDVWQLKTTKPFKKGDSYLFDTKPAKQAVEVAKSSLDEIYAVPNPYVAYSVSENPGRTITKRGDRDLQFRNLPERCTIRIYTITGELVKTIEKDDSQSIASWDLLSSEGMRISYGVYIYHVDAPGIGEKIGRLAIIK